jgi:hypothetical protein
LRVRRSGGDGGFTRVAIVNRGEAAVRLIRAVRELEARLDGVDDDERARLRAELAELRATVRSEKLGEVAGEFDDVHSVERALRVGSIDDIIPPDRLRPRVIEGVQSGMKRTLERG